MLLLFLKQVFFFLCGYDLTDVQGCGAAPLTISGLLHPTGTCSQSIMMEKTVRLFETE